MKALQSLSKVVKKNASTITTIIGAGSIIGGFVLGCKAGAKVSEIICDAKEEIETVKKLAGENPEKYADENHTAEENAELAVKQIRKKAVISSAKELAVPIVLTVGGTASLCAVIGKLKKKNAYLGNALTGLAAAFNQYRQNVINTFGKDIDNQMRFGKPQEEITTTVDEEGKETVETTRIKTSKDDLYTFRFDKTCHMWNRHSIDYNIMTLRQAESMANTNLRIYGVVTILQSLESLGIKPTAVAAVTGWVDDKSLDDYARARQVSFGIDWDDPQKSIYTDPVSGEKYILLDMKVDGAVIDWYDIPKDKITFKRFRGGMKNWLIRSKHKAGIDLNAEEQVIYSEYDGQN